MDTWKNKYSLHHNIQNIARDSREMSNYLQRIQLHSFIAYFDENLFFCLSAFAAKFIHKRFFSLKN